VLAIHIPQSPNPPHIMMSSGRVHVRSGNTTNPVSVVKDRGELDRLYERARENREGVQALLDAHGRGRSFLEEVVQNARRYQQEEITPIAAFCLLAYPETRLPELLAFSSAIPPTTDIANRIFNEADEPARSWARYVGGTGSTKWLDHHRCQTISARFGSLFYVDRFGQVAHAQFTAMLHALTGSPDPICAQECADQLEGFAAGVEFVYREWGYLGPVTLMCRMQLADGSQRPPVQFSAAALELADTARCIHNDVLRDLRRLAGLNDVG